MKKIHIYARAYKHVLLANFCEFYFNVFTDSSELLKALKEYYNNLGENEQEAQRVYNLFRKNYTKRINFKIFDIGNVYVNQFKIGDEIFEFDSINNFKDY